MTCCLHACVCVSIYIYIERSNLRGVSHACQIEREERGEGYMVICKTLNCPRHASLVPYFSLTFILKTSVRAVSLACQVSFELTSKYTLVQSYIKIFDGCNTYKPRWNKCKVICLMKFTVFNMSIYIDNPARSYMCVDICEILCPTVGLFHLSVYQWLKYNNHLICIVASS